MSESIKEPRLLNLYELIAGPLIAIIEAESQAAKTTLEYIEKVGFNAPASRSTENQMKVGKLRMAEFTYRKLDQNNKLTDFKVSVPILSLVPIPIIQINQAKISFSVIKFE